MSHLDPEQLALLALGEPVASDDERAHLAACPACAAEVKEMAHAAMVARTTMEEGALEQPSAEVWARIHDDLSLSPDVAADPLGAQAPAPVAPAAVGPDAAGPGAEGSGRVRQRRSSGRVWALAASLVLVAAGGAIAWTLVSSNLASTPVATAELEAFPDHQGAAGTAEVSEDGEGVRALTVTLDGAGGGADDYREVWLIRNDGEALISLGVLEADSGTFSIPSGVDLTEYDLVDISVEPVDGDPAHSGDSIVRGQLGSR